MFYKKISLLTILFFLFLTGCSDKPITVDDVVGIGDDIAEVFGKDDSDNYGNSTSIAMLEIPPSLDNPNYNDALKVPKSIDASGQILEMSEAPVLPTYIDMMIIKQGNARWLEIQTDPVSLWPYLSQFWRSQGYEIKIDEPINGILETDWKKNEINFDSETNLINNEDFNYNASKEKFRVRVEREPNGFSNIYLSNHIMEADDVVNNNKIIWKKKNSDISREAEMLVRIMEFLGTSREEAIESLNNSEKNNDKLYIDLIDFNGIPAILIKDSFSKMWREIGLSLDRSGLLVQDYDRDKAIYEISSAEIEGKEKIYEIKLTNRGDKYLVTAHSSNRLENISYKDARKILKHILSSYSSAVAKK
tara:strand:+ start:674 stop:1759 length:1086 start_codon:yes stop_codon:yes gene_type:complete